VQVGLQPGSELGPYVVEARVGAGGMGTVYRARDKRLGRLVAVKVLPPHFAASPERRWRFEREAKILAALNHPHICALYDVGHEGDVDYLVMEHVEGTALDRRLKKGRLVVQEVLEYAAQIADAMASAHAKGVIHRDLKPSNLMITDDGLVKVLDFGLAKLNDRAPGEPAPDLPDAETPLTREGAVLGTLPYLSPEQARGEDIDARSDIFAFGSVLHEMITGVRAFERPSAAATLAAVLGDEPPPLRELAPDVPPELERLVARCLRKDPERRLRSMSDLGLGFRELKEESEPGSRRRAASSKVRRASRSAWVFALAAGVLATGALLLSWRRTGRSPRPTPLEVAPLTTYPGTQQNPSLSADGRQVAFSWNGPTQQNFDIYVKAPGSGPPLRLTTDAAEDVAPAWSPDGATIAFLRGRGSTKFSVLLIPALGGPERNLVDVTLPGVAWISPPFLSWFPNSQSIVVTDAPTGQSPTALFRVSIGAAERTPLTFPPPGIMGDSCAAVSPDGTALAFCRGGTVGEWSWSLNAVAIGRAGEPHGDLRQLSKKTWVQGITWSPDSGRIIYSEAGSLWALGFPGSARASGEEPTKLDIPAEAQQPTVARESTRLAYSRPYGGDFDIWRVRLPKPGEKLEPPVRLIASTRNDFVPQYSPDGKRIAFESDRGGHLEIWVCDGGGDNCSPLTQMGSPFTGVPRWSPDGRHLAYYSRVGGEAQIFVIGAEGGAHRRLTLDASNNVFPAWSGDGQWIYHASNRSGTNQVWKLPFQGGKAVQVTRNGGFAAAESPDGKWLYYTRSEARDTALWRLPVMGGEETQVLPSVIFHNFVVLRDGLYFVAGTGQDQSLQFKSFALGTTRAVAPLAAGYVGLSVAPDRTYVLYTVTNPAGSELALVESFR
jgi:eukaryotic-like serine/threonine-protein kinase